MQLEYVTASEVAIPDYLSESFVRYNDKINVEDFTLGIIGMEEFRGNEANLGCESGPDAIRRQLFQLKNFPKIKIIDAGNIKMGVSYKDSHFALKSTLHEMLKADIIPIVLGGDKTLLYAQQEAYYNLHFPFINILQIDEKFKMGNDVDEEITAENYLDHLVNQEPNLIFNFTQLGYQSYFVDALTLDINQKLGFENIRLGEVKEDIKETEPIVRDCDLLAFNVSALRQADASAYHQPTPNGFSADEVCQIVRYAGLSDRLSSIGFYDFNPKYDQQNQTAQIVAQAIWYFIKGVSERKKDYPVVNESDFNIYIVSSKEIGYDITFLKSKKSDRWWIKLPDDHVKYKSHQLFPCSYKDYQMALQDEIPTRWWKAYNKLV
ncbi:MAG: formimidoylglutamase [Chitinophagales bacterium]